MKRFTGFLTAALIFAGTSCFASDQGDAGDRLRWEQKFLRVDRGERFDLLDRSTHRVVLRDLASVFGTYDHERIAIVKRGDKVGALSFDGHLLVPIEYERIDVVEEARVLVVRREGKYGLVGLDGKKRTKLDYDDIDSSYRQHLAWRVKRGGLYGALNPMTGRLVVAPRYANISIDSPFILAHGAQKVSANVGSEVFDLAGRAIPNTKGGMVRIWQAHKLVIVDGSRVVDAAGRVVVENDGLGGIYPIGPRAKAVYRGKARLIDPHGEFVSNRAWDDLIPLSGARDRLALAVENQAGRDEKHYGVITAHGVEVTPVKWDSVTRRSARYGKPKEIEYFVVTRDGTTNSLSSDGELLFDRGFEIVRMRGYDDPLFDVFRDGKFGVCDLSEGFCPIPPRYDSLRRAGRFSPGSDLYIAEREGRYGLINPADEAILPFQFDDIRSVTGTGRLHPIIITAESAVRACAHRRPNRRTFGATSRCASDVSYRA
ncbi:MAG: WG repeat-containing protein [Rhodocyclaceae bacterium]